MSNIDSGYTFVEELLSIECHVCGSGSYETDPGKGVFWCHNCQKQRVPYVTNHSLNRWAEYTDEKKVPERVIDVWRSAVPVVQDPRDWNDDSNSASDVPIDERIGHRFVGKQARYHEPTETVILLRNGDIRTVIDAPDARLNAKCAIVQTYLARDASATTIESIATISVSANCGSMTLPVATSSVKRSSRAICRQIRWR
jgi:hypothetical protein